MFLYSISSNVYIYHENCINLRLAWHNPGFQVDHDCPISLMWPPMPLILSLSWWNVETGQNCHTDMVPSTRAQASIFSCFICLLNPYGHEWVYTRSRCRRRCAALCHKGPTSIKLLCVTWMKCSHLTIWSLLQKEWDRMKSLLNVLNGYQIGNRLILFFAVVLFVSEYIPPLQSLRKN